MQKKLQNSFLPRFYGTRCGSRRLRHSEGPVCLSDSHICIESTAHARGRAAAGRRLLTHRQVVAGQVRAVGGGAAP